jgi:hypothetical protein
MAKPGPLGVPTGAPREAGAQNELIDPHLTSEYHRTDGGNNETGGAHSARPELTNSTTPKTKTGENRRKPASTMTKAMNTS